MRALALRDVYTPQVVVDGRLQAAAVDREAVDKLVSRVAKPRADPPQLTPEQPGSHRRRRPPAAARVGWCAIEPGDQSVRVLAGANRGQTIVEHNVVRELSGWALARPGPAFACRRRPTGLKTVVIIQAVRSGRILAVAAAVVLTWFAKRGQRIARATGGAFGRAGFSFSFAAELGLRTRGAGGLIRIRSGRSPDRPTHGSWRRKPAAPRRK